MNYDTDNTLSSTTKDAKALANEIYQRVYVIYYVADDEFDYSEVKPDTNEQVIIMREVKPDPVHLETGCNGLKYNTVR